MLLLFVHEQRSSPPDQMSKKKNTTIITPKKKRKNEFLTIRFSVEETKAIEAMADKMRRTFTDAGRIAILDRAAQEAKS